MSLILNIDSATKTAQVSIARDGIVLQSMHNEKQNDHASFLQVAIQQVMMDAQIKLMELDAIAVTAGPGSYTGIRVGVASARGLCYALQKPLISLNTLTVWAAGAIDLMSKISVSPAPLFCPMIDARRNEVFTAVYDHQLNIILAPCAMILDEGSFKNQLAAGPVIFFGNGAAKWESQINDPNASFEPIEISPAAMANLSNRYFYRQDFTSLVDSQPLYLKEYNTGRDM
jgi:tRNA threonylcarbamoyladenosine biosynthesis protein TsaB